MNNQNVIDFVVKEYPIVAPFCGRRYIENRLMQQGFMVVLESDRYWGILTPADIIERPRLLVADCLIEKVKINIHDNIRKAYECMVEHKTTVLPVFDNNKFVGVIHAGDLGENMMRHQQTMSNMLYNKENELNETRSNSDYIFRDMLKNISHEVRTPLNVIMGFSQLLSDDSIDKNDRKRYIQHILEGGDRLINAINNIFEKNECYIREISGIQNKS